MARTVKHAEHAVKRNDILDSAEKLIYAKGYEQMAIQDILDDIRMSKGAFYHYFGSKQALLEALIERIYQAIAQLLRQIVDDPQPSAVVKLNDFLYTGGRWKTDHKDLLVAMLQGWYADHNALFRQKVTSTMIKRATPMLTEIVRQGVREGVFTTPYPDETAELLYALMLAFGDAFAELILAPSAPSAPSIPSIPSIPGIPGIPSTISGDAQNDGRMRRGLALTAACTDAMERMLGAQKGSLELMDQKTLKQWLVKPQEKYVANLSNGTVNGQKH